MGFPLQGVVKNLVLVKGTVSRDFLLLVFSWLSFSQASDYTKTPFQILTFTTRVVDTGGHWSTFELQIQYIREETSSVANWPIVRLDNSKVAEKKVAARRFGLLFTGHGPDQSSVRRFLYFLFIFQKYFSFKHRLYTCNSIRWNVLAF